MSASTAVQRLRICGLGGEGQRFADRRPDHRCIRTHAIESAVGFVYTSGRNATHRANHRVQLVDGADSLLNFAEFAAHETGASRFTSAARTWARSRTAATSAARAVSSIFPVFVTTVTMSL